MIIFFILSATNNTTTSQNGWTPLMQASQEGHVDVVNVLLDHGANANHQTDVSYVSIQIP